MLVREAIEKLKEMDQDAELHFCVSCHTGPLGRQETREAEEIYESTTQYGILTKEPKTVGIVVLDTGSCGL